MTNRLTKAAEFAAEHMNDDVHKLLLNRKKWTEVDIDLAVECIESRKKLKGKVNQWYVDESLVFPSKLSAEQCSSSLTAEYKSNLAERIAYEKTEWTLADLTGGMGVDSWFFSMKAKEVMYCEMREELCTAARYNFEKLGVENIRICNRAVVPDADTGNKGGRVSELLSEFKPDIVYIDPARRGEGGRKVFLIEDCTPDILKLKEDIFKHSRHILLKLSPMADINIVTESLGKSCREVHITAAGGECKELLIWMDREWEGEYKITAVELEEGTKNQSLTFFPSKEREAGFIPALPESPESLKGKWLFEPGKALMKSGGFNLISQKYNISKLGKSTHYYILEHTESAEYLSGLGKVYRIKECLNLDKRSIKDAGRRYPHSEVTSRNIPMDTETLRKKLGVSSGDDAHIFGLKCDSLGNLLFITERCFISSGVQV